MQHIYHWPHMDSEAYTAVTGCHSSAPLGTRTRHQKRLRLFPSSGSLEFLAMDTLGPLPKMKSGTQHVNVLTYKFNKLKRAIQVTTETSTSAATIFIENWVILDGIPTYLLIGNGLQLVSKLFAEVIARFGIKHMTKNFYHPYTKGYEEQFHRKTVASLRHYNAEHQDRPGPVRATADACIHRAGIPIDGQEAIQLGTLSSATAPYHRKPGQRDSR